MKQLTSREALEQAGAIIIAMKHGLMDYDKAKAKCMPLLKIANDHICIIAKKYKQSPKIINFASFARSI